MEKQTAVNIVKETFQNPFNKERFTYFTRELLNKIDKSKAFHARGYVPEIFKDHIKTYERIGTYTDPENKKTDILIVYLQKETTLDRARTAQRNFVARYLKDRGEKDAGLIAFVSPDEEDWRFSFVKMEYKLVETPKGTIKAEEEFTPARRYSFLVGKNENSHTAQSSLVPLLREDEHNPTLKEIEEAFSIERVTKEFFEKYRELFLKVKEALDGIVEKDVNIKKDFTQKGVSTIDFAKKLLGQIVFLYFLQKKGWFGVGRDADWGTGPKDFLRLLFEKRIANYKNFFNDILEPLFYEALANERTADFYSRFNCKIPFLNGGLFDPINNYDWVHTDILLPNELFSNDVKTKESDTGTGILDVFDRYNFTVKEDEPLEKEVAIDPEMLGKVFENLLEVKDRKSKGTYYTPREIVHYMCQESLINYLVTELSSSVIASEAKQSPLPTKEDIETFIKYGETALEHDIRVVSKGRETETYYYKIPESIRNNAELIDEKLANIRVCDPAIGSGAFPVGMMHEIVKARETLTTYIPTLEKGGEGGFSEERTPYNFKRHAIQNCLYGVDIDPSAVEIAKLRLWLSLMVDEEDIEHIKPLPNLDYKIVCGNSLVGVERNLLNAHLFKELEALKQKYFNETSSKRKTEERNNIDEIIRQITNNDEHFDFKVYFSEVFRPSTASLFVKVGEGGFDIVIANPPYVRQEDIKELKPILQRQGYEVYNSTSDLYTYFYEKAYQVLDNQGIFCFISSNKFMRAKYGEKLRRFLQEKTALKQIIDFGGHKVFESATVDTCIVIFEKQYPTEDKTNPPFSKGGLGGFSNEVRLVNISDDFRNSHDLAAYITEKGFCIPQSKLSPQHWTLADDSVLRLKEKIERIGTPLKDWDVRICFGIKTGFNEAFIIDNETKERLCKEDPKSAEILKPILRGRDIERYSYKWAGLWLIKIESGWTNENRGKKDPERFFKDTYPAVYEHLKSMGEKKGKGKGLYNRDDQGDYWWGLRDCDYYGEFEKEKIVYPDISERLSFAFENGVKFVNNTAYFLNAGNKYLLAVLNSLLADFYYRQISSQLGNEAIRAFTIFIEQIPIPKIPEKAQQPFITLVDQILTAKQKDPNADTSALERQIDEIVYALYGLTLEEIKIVEGKG
jgi:hypothetical protein